MRISFQTGFRNALADIQRTASELARRQREVSSGRRLQAPSDDPTAAVGAVAEHAEVAALDRYARAADSVGARLALVDTILSDVVSKLTAARTTVTGALGSTPTAAQREAAALELEGIRDALFSDFNTAFRGSYVFAGTASTSPPYVKNPDGSVGPYQGNGTVTLVDVDRSTAVQVSFVGQAVTQGADSEDVFAVLQTLITDVVAGDTAAIETGLAALGRAFDRAVSAQTRVGTDQAALEDQRVRLASQKLGAKARLSSHEDANMVEAISGMQQADAAYRAALGATATIQRVSLLDYLR